VLFKLSGGPICSDRYAENPVSFLLLALFAGHEMHLPCLSLPGPAAQAMSALIPPTGLVVGQLSSRACTADVPSSRKYVPIHAGAWRHKPRSRPGLPYSPASGTGHIRAVQVLPNDVQRRLAACRELLVVGGRIKADRPQCLRHQS